MRQYVLFGLIGTLPVIVACDLGPRVDRIANTREKIAREIEHMESSDFAKDPFIKYKAQCWTRGLEILEGRASDENLPTVPFYAGFRDRNPTSQKIPEKCFFIAWIESGNAVTGFYFRFEENDVYDFPVLDPSDKELTEMSRHSVLRDQFVALVEKDKEKKEDFPGIEKYYSAEVTSETVDRIYSGKPFSVGLLLKDGSRSEAIEARFFPVEQSNEKEDEQESATKTKGVRTH